MRVENPRDFATPAAWRKCGGRITNLIIPRAKARG